MFSFDESFWVGAAFILFVALIAKPVGSFIIKQLDRRSSRIKAELDEAVRLKEEAQAVLALYQRKQRKAIEEAEEIINHAQEEAARIIEISKKNLEDELKKRTELALQKIEQAEANIVKEIRQNAVDITISAAKTLILENLEKDAEESIVLKAISDIDRKFH